MVLASIRPYAAESCKPSAVHFYAGGEALSPRRRSRALDGHLCVLVHEEGLGECGSKYHWQ